MHGRPVEALARTRIDYHLSFIVFVVFVASLKDADMANYGEQYEAQHVHEVYEQIASHFSSTRYKV